MEIPTNIQTSKLDNLLFVQCTQCNVQCNVLKHTIFIRAIWMEIPTNVQTSKLDNFVIFVMYTNMNNKKMCVQAFYNCGIIALVFNNHSMCLVWFGLVFFNMRLFGKNAQTSRERSLFFMVLNFKIN